MAASHLAIFPVIAAVLLGGKFGHAAEPPLSFDRDVEPILQANCYRCHGEKTRKAELDLTSAAGMRRGGETGRLVDPGKPEESLLYKMVREGQMPPPENEPLSAAEVGTIRRWIAEGASLGARGNLEPPASVSLQDVMPILFRRCTVCHGSQAMEAGLDMRTRTGMQDGGHSGPALVPGEPDRSTVVQRVRDQLCPPSEAVGEAGIEPMTADELAVLERWISLGAPAAARQESRFVTAEDDPQVDPDERRFWSFQTPQKTPPPSVDHAGRVRNPVDAFLLEKLEAADLSYSDEADKLTLLRRASFALTGLPPSPEEIATFLEDKQPKAYERLIDRLLASPRYGERWGRVWLDLAGYADSEGKRNADSIRPWAWRYRDYVIRSFNEDKPYDQFLLEQLAGDELVDYADAETVSEDTVEKLVATGFLRMAPDGTAADPVNRISDRIEVIADEIDVLSRGVMGLTMDCARCHSHKYDPLPQRDYYRLVAVFKGAYDEYDWLVPQPGGNQWKKAQSRYLTVVTPAKRRRIERHNRPIQEQIEGLNNKLNSESHDRQQAKQIRKQIESLESDLRELPKIRALWDRGQPSPAYIYRRGDEMQPARRVDAGVPSALAAETLAVDVEPPRHATPKTGRRLAFARWLVQPDHPLTARVLVNRIWQQHFGTGIVESLDNFGALGTPPSHPELLDWLAVELVEHGWSIKHLHRLLMTSAAYRQVSAVPPARERLDPENRLLSRMPMRRMSAEELRDSVLLIAGRLDATRYGEPDPVEVRKDGLVTSVPSDGRWRRSVYVRQRRKELPSILETFDLPQMNPNCIERRDSTIVSQPLHLLNNRMIYELAGACADRVQRESGSDLREQVQYAWLVTLNRLPSEQELEISLRSLEELTAKWRAKLIEENRSGPARQQALRDYCHALINSAGFLYID